MQTLGIVVIFAGSAVIYKVKIDNNRPNLKTIHGRLGALFVLFGLSQAFFGFLKSRVFLRRWIKSGFPRKMHAISGALYFALGSLVTGLGFRTEWFQQRALAGSIQDQGVRMLINYVLSFFLCLLVIVISKQVYDRYFSKEDYSTTTTSTQSRKVKRSK